VLGRVQRLSAPDRAPSRTGTTTTSVTRDSGRPGRRTTHIAITSTSCPAIDCITGRAGLAAAGPCCPAHSSPGFHGWRAEVCGLRTRISADPDPQILLRTRTVRGSTKQTHLRTRTIRGSKATSIICRTNLERKCQCTSSQQFEN